MEAYKIIAPKGVTPEQYLDALAEADGLDSLGKRVYADHLIKTPGKERAALYDAFGLTGTGLDSVRNLTDDQAAVAFACENMGISQPSREILDGYKLVSDRGVTVDQYAKAVGDLSQIRSLKSAAGKTITNSSSLQKRAYIDSIITDSTVRKQFYDLFDVSKTVQSMSEAEVYSTLNRYLQ